MDLHPCNEDPNFINIASIHTRGCLLLYFESCTVTGITIWLERSLDVRRYPLFPSHKVDTTRHLEPQRFAFGVEDGV